MSRIRLDIFNIINFNQDAEEVLLFGWELMKRNRHTYGTLSLFFFFSSFDPLPDPYAIWESVDKKIREFNACSVSLQMLLKESKSLPLLFCSLPWAHESEGYSCSPFNDGPFYGVLFHLEEIFIVKLSPVARFEHAVPYVVFCLATLLLN